MLILPVIDLLGGVVVRGVAGRREEYQPINSRLTGDPSPAAVAGAMVERFGFEDIYVADLDAIAGHPPAWAVYQAIAAAGLKLWVDAGVGDASGARDLARTPVGGCQLHRVIIGLESLSSLSALHEIVGVVGPDRTVFSLDLQDGRPLTASSEIDGQEPFAVAQSAYDCGVRRMIVLDLADVGTDGGTRTTALIRRIKDTWPEVELIGGGGVRGPQELRQLTECGLSRVLVASALHDGRLTREAAIGCLD